MADIGRRCNSSAHYVLLEDSAALPGRSMTLPHSPADGHDSPKKTFSRSPHSASAASVEEGEVIRQPSTAPPRALQAKGGILRQSISVDGSGAAPAQLARPKKQVSISLPGSSKPIITARRKQTRRDNAPAIAEEDEEVAGQIDGSGGGDNDRPEQVIVQVDVHESADIPVGKHYNIM